VNQVATIYQDRKTGKRVRLVGSQGGKEEFVLVKGQDNVPYHALLSNLIPCDNIGTPDYRAVITREEEADEAIPAPIIDLVETRLNINAATAEEIAKRIPGLGYRTAKRIKDLQLSLPGEVFRTLDQVKAASSRPNWDAIMEQNVMFIG
jgi:hypothetical protein